MDGARRQAQVSWEIEDLTRGGVSLHLSTFFEPRRQRRQRLIFEYLVQVSGLLENWIDGIERCLEGAFDF